MKKIIVISFLALALPLAALAGDVNFINNGGTLAGSSVGLALTGSQLTTVVGLNGNGGVQGDLGTVTFATGALLSGNLTTGGTFTGAGSSFIITGNGSPGVPNGVIFSGTFSGALTWVEDTNCGTDGSVCYTLYGSITGIWYTGQTANGATVQLTFNAGKNGFTGSVPLASGDTVIGVVPEPGTLGLLGTGLAALTGLARKKTIFRKNVALQPSQHFF